ncbi:hypothetical protein C2S51_004970 [Perilla frutescens var. frutescens]|nr:hypothetical protein C2S51_004970 [Perilla frutescens var. frutescens]
MDESTTILMLIYFLGFSIAIPKAHGIDQSPKSVESWLENLPNLKEKVVRFHFYFHDQVSGENPTAFPVAKASISHTSPTGFGLIRMIDDPLTVGPELESKMIGRLQGTYGKSSFEEISMLMTLNILFTEGEYNGSTLSLFGRDAILDEYREMSIVGGSDLSVLTPVSLPLFTRYIFLFAYNFFHKLTVGETVSSFRYNTTIPARLRRVN